ncbi:MAG: TolC family outer membrane protein [Pseudomonadota bacterium]
MKFLTKTLCGAGVLAAASLAGTLPVTAADTLTAALAKAYENNSSLNAARAGVRVANEGVPLAKSGWRPRVTATLGVAAIEDSSRNNGSGFSTATFGIEINQSIFDGFQTRNNVQSAEAQVRAERQNLRNTELNTLQDTAQIYMDVVQNRRIERLRAQNLEFLREQLRAARARLEVGEGTRTDVAQADASLAAAQAALTAARANTAAAEAQFVQVVGVAPGKLRSAKPLSSLIPSSLGQAESIAFREHPAILLQSALVDSGVFSVKAAEGAFLPQVSLSASLQQQYSTTGGGGTLFGGPGRDPQNTNSATIGAQVTIPIYQGGAAAATVRQRKEQLGQQRLQKDVARDGVRAAVTTAWTNLQAARASVVANGRTVEARRLALDGVVEERNVGQRTTLDVLDAQAVLIGAQIDRVISERNLVVASYAVASSTGRLSAKKLGLHVKLHEPERHYNQVKDAWFGLRTPDGR